MASPVRFIAVAPNGGRRTHADHPALPVTAEALAETARDCLRAGAAMIHDHVRDAEQRHVLDAVLYRDAIAAIRRAVGDDLVVQITTESVGRYSPAEQMAVVRAARPEAVSVAMCELAPAAADVEAFADFVRETVAAGTAVQIIVYEADELARLERYASFGLFDAASLSILMVFGRYAGPRDATLADVEAWIAHRASGTIWRDMMVCAFGPGEAAVTAAAARHGADVRVGFENNLWLPDGTLAGANAEIVAAAAAALRAEGLTLGGAKELAERWGLARR
jgi:uncharacterized protein (DUF849 family)